MIPKKAWGALNIPIWGNQCSLCSFKRSSFSSDSWAELKAERLWWWCGVSPEERWWPPGTHWSCRDGRSHAWQLLHRVPSAPERGWGRTDSRNPPPLQDTSWISGTSCGWERVHRQSLNTDRVMPSNTVAAFYFLIIFFCFILFVWTCTVRIDFKL